VIIVISVVLSALGLVGFVLLKWKGPKDDDADGKLLKPQTRWIETKLLGALAHRSPDGELWTLKQYIFSQNSLVNKFFDKSTGKLAFLPSLVEEGIPLECVWAEFLFNSVCVALALILVFASLNSGVQSSSENCSFNSGNSQTETESSESSVSGALATSVDFKASAIVSAIGLVRSWPIMTLFKGLKCVGGRFLLFLSAVALVGGGVGLVFMAHRSAERSAATTVIYAVSFVASFVISVVFADNITSFIKFCVARCIDGSQSTVLPMNNKIDKPELRVNPLFEVQAPTGTGYLITDTSTDK
jgi:hypothetical protein